MIIRFRFSHKMFSFTNFEIKMHNIVVVEIADAPDIIVIISTTKRATLTRKSSSSPPLPSAGKNNNNNKNKNNTDFF